MAQMAANCRHKSSGAGVEISAVIVNLPPGIDPIQYCRQWKKSICCPSPFCIFSGAGKGGRGEWGALSLLGVLSDTGTPIIIAGAEVKFQLHRTAQLFFRRKIGDGYSDQPDRSSGDFGPGQQPDRDFADGFAVIQKMVKTGSPGDGLEIITKCSISRVEFYIAWLEMSENKVEKERQEIYTWLAADPSYHKNKIPDGFCIEEES